MSTAEIELHAAQALFAARLLEAAVHDEGPWTMRWGSVEIPATRCLHPDGVCFHARFPATCWLSPAPEGLLLLLRGEVMGLKRVDDPGDTAFRVLWEVFTQDDDRVDV